MANKIRQAYEQGKRIRVKDWVNGSWIKKYSDTQSITEYGAIWWGKCWSFYTKPEEWEIWHEDLPLLTHPNTLPETLIINGIKYKRNDN